MINFEYGSLFIRFIFSRLFFIPFSLFIRINKHFNQNFKTFKISFLKAFFQIFFCLGLVQSEEGLKGDGWVRTERGWVGED